MVISTQVFNFYICIFNIPHRTLKVFLSEALQLNFKARRHRLSSYGTKRTRW